MYIGVDHGLKGFAYDLENTTKSNSLIFGNNYVRIKSFLTDSYLKNKNFASFPHKEEEFYKFLNNAPINSCFYITNEINSMYPDPSNKYLKKNYIEKDIITSDEKNNREISDFNLTLPIAVYRFNINSSIINDLGRYGNNGLSYNVSFIDSLYNKSAFFDNSLGSYIIINNSNNYIFNKALSISFIANLTAINGTIVSSFNNEMDSILHIYLLDNSLFYVIKNVGMIMVDSSIMQYYFNSWHHFLFIYDNYRMRIIIDGSIKSDKLCEKYLDNKTFLIKIGSNNDYYYNSFTGLLDNFQISNYSLDTDKLYNFLKENCYSVFINKKVYYLDKNNPDIYIKYYFNIKDLDINKSTSKAILYNINCYSKVKTFFLTFNIHSTKESIITVLLCGKFFTKVINFKINQGENKFSYNISSIGDSLDIYSDRYVYTKLYYFNLIVIENNQIIYNQILSVQDNSFILVSFLLIIFFLSLITIISYSRIIDQFFMGIIYKIFLYKNKKKNK
ncbi:MAG: LamG-like jellyroll fold domain-containing protein [Candidatus Helarchaeota archaeon]